MRFDDLNDKIALITGSSTGIGAALARAFAAQGSVVAVHYAQSAEAADALVAEITAAGGKAEAFQADLTGSAAARALVDAVVARLGGIDILINNAGALVQRIPIAELDEATYDKVLDVNIRSAVMCTQAALPTLKERRGTVINTGSIAGRNGGGPGAGIYGATKAFIQNWTRNLAKELAPLGMRANAVAPGVIQTPFHERFTTPELMETMRKSIPLQRVGTPEDMVGTYLFLASEAASGYITGEVIEVNGGLLMA